MYLNISNFLDKILDFLGEGTFSKVVEVWDRKERAYCAMKIIRSIEKYSDAAEIEVDLLRNINKKRDKR